MTKRVLFLSFSLLLLGLPLHLLAQSRGISYQAVARDANGVLIPNQTVNVGFQIREGAANGTVIYDETHSPSTNDYSLFSVVIGDGTVNTGDFTNIGWASNPYFLEVQINGASVGVTELLAVPYSKVATDMGLDHLQDVDATGVANGQVLKFDGSQWIAGDDSSGVSVWETNGNDIFYNTGRIGIGTNAPSSAIHAATGGNNSDVRIDDTFPFVFLNSTTGSGNSGLKFENQGDYDGWIYHEGSSDAILISGENTSVAQPNLTVNSQGRVGIGTKTPAFPLHLAEDTMSINGLEIANLGSSNLGLDGDVVPYGGSGLAFDLGNNTATEHWDDVVASAFVTFSDAQLKQQIVDLPVGLNEVLSLRPVQYRYRPEIDVDGALRYGLLAQEVEPVLPSVVITDDVDVNPETGAVERTTSPYKAMNYVDLVPVLIKSIQEQQDYIQSLEARIEQLEQSLNE